MAELAKINPGVIHKLDTDSVVDEYAKAIGTPISILRSSEEAQIIREQVAEAQQQQIQMQQITEGAAAAKDLSQADLEGNNALSRLASQGPAA